MLRLDMNLLEIMKPSLQMNLFIYLELDKQKEGLAVDLIIDEDNTLIFEENNDVFIDKIDIKE